MNLLYLTTYAHGGAGIACRRLQAAIQETGTQTDLLTFDQQLSRWPFYAERLSFLLQERDKSVRFAFSPANFGHDLRQHPLVQKADILHLHWINQGFLSLRNIRQLASTGKPVIWTLHDMWAFTGGCHYSGPCTRFRENCGNCPMLRRPGPADLSRQVLGQKSKFFAPNIHFVTCSEWLAEMARSSSLLRQFPIRAIPNPIDTGLFHPASGEDHAAFRQQRNIAPGTILVLFAAMKVKETRKGFSYLREALQCLKQQKPALSVELLVLGQAEPDELATLPYPVHALGLIRDNQQLAKIYGIADAFVIPSLEDNLPNTVMESLACGTPVVGFETGGIPEMVTHLVEGFIAPQKDKNGLAAGISWVVEDKAQQQKIRQAARSKAVHFYSNAVVAGRYLQLYREALLAPGTT